MRILQISDPKELKRLMREIRVDPCGIEIMLPKAAGYLIRINSLSCIEANILKQEMLSLGGDAAVARDALSGKVKKTDCLLIGTFCHYERLNEKLKKQPFALKRIAFELSRIIANYRKSNFVLDLGGYKLTVRAAKTAILGIVNLTPDSFSGDGLYRSPRHQVTKSQVNEIVDYAQKMISDGADIIDVGGESTRPGATPVSVKEELARTIPLIKILAKSIKAPISIDTYKPQVASAALDNGASLINDVTGLRDPQMVKVASKHKCAVIIMHSKGTPRNMQRDPRYTSLMGEIIGFLDRAIRRAQDAGIDKNRIIVDPGIGFGKTVEHNLEILKNLGELKVLGEPILVGPSRKSFIGKILNTDTGNRLSATIAACILAVKNGAGLLRVHDVREIKQAVKIIDAVNKLL